MDIQWHGLFLKSNTIKFLRSTLQYRLVTCFSTSLNRFSTLVVSSQLSSWDFTWPILVKPESLKVPLTLSIMYGAILVSSLKLSSSSFLESSWVKKPCTTTKSELKIISNWSESILFSTLSDSSVFFYSGHASGRWVMEWALNKLFYAHTLD